MGDGRSFYRDSMLHRIGSNDRQFAFASTNVSSLETHVLRLSRASCYHDDHDYTDGRTAASLQWDCGKIKGRFSEHEVRIAT